MNDQSLIDLRGRGGRVQGELGDCAAEFPAPRRAGCELTRVLVNVIQYSALPAVSLPPPIYLLQFNSPTGSRYEPPGANFAKKKKKLKSFDIMDFRSRG